MKIRARYALSLAPLLVVLPGCGGDDDDTGTPITTTDGGSDAGSAGDGSTTTTGGFTVGGDITGLADGGSITLVDNGGDALIVSRNGSFTFGSTVATGKAYSVRVKAQPTSPSQECVVNGGDGTIAGANVSSVHIVCTTGMYKVGGTVTGLSGTGLVLEDNGGDDITVAADGTFTFPTTVASGAAFAVTVKTQPSGPSQTCTVSGGSGTIASGDVSSVTVNCAGNTFTVGGTIAGLTGSGLVLEDNGGDDVTVNTTDGTFAFPTALADGQAYNVTVKTQPGTPNQRCTVTSGSGKIAGANVGDVAISCVQVYAVGGTVSGLAAGNTLVLADNGTDKISITADGTYTFPKGLATGETYLATSVSVRGTIPQVCSISHATDTLAMADVTDVNVICADAHAVSVTVEGLFAGDSIVLQDNATDDLTVSSNTTAAFATRLATGTTYDVSVLTQPAHSTCVVGAPSGTVGTGDVVVGVTCRGNYFVDVTNGADTNDGLSAATAWKTLTHATTATSLVGGNITVAPGTYNSASGETFPIVPSSHQHFTGDVANKGKGAVPTFINGNGPFSFKSAQAGNGSYPAAIGIGTSAFDVSFDGFDIVSGSYATIVTAGGSLTVADSTVTDTNADYTFFLTGATHLALMGDAISSSYDAIYPFDSSTVAVRNTSLSAEYGFFTWEVPASSFDLGTTASPGGNTFTCSETCVYFYTGGTINAAGNTWTANTEGADANGQYTAGSLATGYQYGANFYLGDGNSKIQF